MLLEDMPAKGVLRLKINRPEARNALSLELRTGLARRLSLAEDDSAVRAVVIGGSEKSFASGADLNELANLTPLQVYKLGYQKLWRAISDFRKPLIAAVRGYALGGGCELAMHCDIIVAGRSAKFGLPEIRVGIMPGAGGTQRLVRAVGKYRAMRVLLTGEMLDAPTAENWGLLSHVVDDENVESAALEIAAKVAGGPALAIEHIKEVVLSGADVSLDVGLALERKSFHMLFDTADQKEGMKAFLESRKPNFW